MLPDNNICLCILYHDSQRVNFTTEPDEKTQIIESNRFRKKMVVLTEGKGRRNCTFVISNGYDEIVGVRVAVSLPTLIAWCFL